VGISRQAEVHSCILRAVLGRNPVQMLSSYRRETTHQRSTRSPEHCEGLMIALDFGDNRPAKRLFQG
jgi:hypothetical protein